MAETTHADITIAAPVDVVFGVLVDFERYPEWIDRLKQAKVRSTDADGRAAEVQFRAAGMGRSTTYTLGYDYADAPRRLAWDLVEGDIERVLGGSYQLVEQDGGTLVRYELEIETIVPLPSFVKRRAESDIVKSALENLKRQVESVA